jgi:C-terminal processing protease CtpA/Prc
MDLTRNAKEKILNEVSRLVERKHFNPKLNGVDWLSTVQNYTSRVLNTEGPEDFEKEMQAMVSQLKTSHTGFFHRNARNIPARLAINATVESLAVDGEERWMFRDVHEGGPAAAAGIDPGDIVLAVGVTEIRPPSPLVFKMGESATLTLRKLDGSELVATLKVPTPKDRKHPVSQPKSVLYKRLADGVGFLKVNIFPGAVGIDMARETGEAMNQLGDCERLIIDLRGNTGGGIGGLRLMSYLTPDKIPVGYSLTKGRAEKGYQREKLPQFGRIPSNKVALVWLALRYGFIDKSIVVVTEGLGPQKFHGRIVMLVNQHTASAAEIVAAFAQENSLAMIVGAKTAGRLLSGTAFKVGHGYLLGLPVGAYLTWQGTMIEGKGVTPDVAVDLPYETLKKGRDDQLEKAIEVAKG